MLLALALLAALRLPNAVRRWVGGVARESLVVYVAHLVVLYGSPLSRGLRHAPGATLALPAACAVTGVLLAAMLLLATLWPGLLRRGLWSRSLVRLPITGLLVYVLLLR
jgi:surface polysaccharide O-acyltransferase-like enzyme